MCGIAPYYPPSTCKEGYINTNAAQPALTRRWFGRDVRQRSQRRAICAALHHTTPHPNVKKGTLTQMRRNPPEHVFGLVEMCARGHRGEPHAPPYKALARHRHFIASAAPAAGGPRLPGAGTTHPTAPTARAGVSCETPRPRRLAPAARRISARVGLGKLAATDSVVATRLARCRGPAVDAFMMRS